jgi:DNA modification methylase
MELRNIETLRPNPNNDRILDEAGKTLLLHAMSMGDHSTFLITPEGMIIDGNNRWNVRFDAGWENKDVQCRVLTYGQDPTKAEKNEKSYYAIIDGVTVTDHDVIPHFYITPEALYKAYSITRNTEAAYDDPEAIANKWAEWQLDASRFSLSFTPPQTVEFMLEQLAPQDGLSGEEKDSLVGKFLIPPFSVLDARQGYWQERKRNWIKLGISSEEGRDDTLLYGDLEGRTDVVSTLIGDVGGATSIFDPVLCEIMYKWFTPKNGLILDPFAGGSVRGIVANYLDFLYTGIDLSEKQVIANREQAPTVLGEKPAPVWHIGDSNTVLDTINEQYDFVFSCPPYADLEVYSDDPNDLSNMEYPAFVQMYTQIIQKACSKLKDNRFAAFVVGEIRDKKGIYRNFVGDTTSAFLSAGMSYYNEAILVTQAGSLPLRVNAPFGKYRKLGKTHQNVLIFFKGDPQTIKDNFDTTIADNLPASQG